MDGLVHGARDTFGPDFWGPVFALLDTAWPDLSGRVARAAELGFPWASCTHPFVWFEGGRALAHVGVLAHPVRVGGEDRVMAGLHAVCSHPEARGRGLIRRLSEAALAWADGWADGAKLHTDYPDLYARFGFRVQPTWRFRAERRGGGGAGRILRPTQSAADRAVLLRAIRDREASSDRFASRDPGWLVAIDAALQRSLDTLFVASPDEQTVVAARVDGGVLRVHEVLGRLAPFVDWFPQPFERVLYACSADRLDPSAEAEPVPQDEGYFMVRGRFDVAEPFGVGGLAEH